MRTRTLLATVLVTMITATVTVGLAATPASAAPPPMFGYVWGWQPANPDYISATGYEYNSSGGPVRIIRPAIGTYHVRFIGMAGTGGVAHASAYGGSNICTISGYGPLWADELVTVRCYNPAGAPVDSRFVANVTNRKLPGSFGYFRSDNPVPPIGGYVPPATWSYDSTGAPIVVHRTSVGHYEIELGAFAQDSPGLWANGYLRATTYGASANQCKVNDPNFVVDPSVIGLLCYDTTGAWVDTAFTLTYSRGVMLDASATFDNYGGAPVLDGWSNAAGGAPTVTEIDHAVYDVAFPNAGVSFGHAIVTIMEPPPMYCNIQAWWTAAGWEHLIVGCFNPGNGAPNVGVLVNVAFVK